MTKTKFTHLHVHSEYSLLDGLSKVSELIDYVKSLNQEAIAITDHGVLYGAIEFYQKCLEKQIKPIIGMEAYTTDIDLRKRVERGKYKNFHLILLAKNEKGYKNLMELTSIAHLEGFLYRPRVDRTTLKEYAEGLICLSACAQGEVAQALIEDDFEKAKEIAKWFLDVFGDDYYLELQRHRYQVFGQEVENERIKKNVLEMAENEKKINEGKVTLSRELGIPLVATNDAHYIKKEDATAQDALVCIATGKNVADTERLRFIDVPSYYVAPTDEMYEAFSDYPESCQNTNAVAKKCNLKIATLGQWHFPEFELPKGKSAEKYLEELAHARLPEKIEQVSAEVKERLDQELKIINDKGFATYFLIMMDLVNWANDEGIITNTRGSVAGSLVSFVLGITKVNPLTYLLPFERFLNPFRPLPPDIDLDVADDRREEILKYIGTKYGAKKVAQICTFGRMLSRGSVRDIARVLGYPYAVGDRIAKLIPLPRQGFPIYISKAKEETRELKDLYQTDADAKKILDLAEQIEGNARHVSVHAAAVVISPKKLTEFTPLQKEPSGEKVITQYEMHATEDVGLIKLDILGIRNLSILGEAVRIVEETRGKTINIDSIPLDDRNTFEMLSRGETLGVFQLSGGGMTRYLKELKPTRVEDLMAMVALYRPGPMAVIPEYIRRKRNPKLVNYMDPRMKKFLDKSYGLLVYQDDLLFCALELAGYDWKEADKFRKAVGKKIPREMEAQKEKFIKGVVDSGQTSAFAEKLWRLFEPFQAYGFNKAHAASYGIVAYQTAYMKANFPVEFMTALLTAESSDTDKVAEAIAECRRMKIKVMPPDINESKIGFTIVKDKNSLEGQAIRFGLNAIKNVGKAAIQAILTAREDNLFTSFEDIISRADARRVNKKVLESLIKVGALSKFGSRAGLLSSIDEVRNKLASTKKDINQQGLFSQEEVKQGLRTLDKVNEINEFADEEIELLEHDLLGFSLSAKPIAERLGGLDVYATHKIGELLASEFHEDTVKIAAIVSEVKVIVTKRSRQEMAFIKVADDTGRLELVVFPSIFQRTKSVWASNTPLLITGRVDSKDEGATVLVEAIETRDEAGDSGRLIINVPAGAGRKELSFLKRLLEENPGEQPVTLNFEGRKVGFVNLKMRVNWSEQLARKISEIIHD